MTIIAASYVEHDGVFRIIFHLFESQAMALTVFLEILAVLHKFVLEAITILLQNNRLILCDPLQIANTIFFFQKYLPVLHLRRMRLLIDKYKVQFLVVFLLSHISFEFFWRIFLLALVLLQLELLLILLHLLNQIDRLDVKDVRHLGLSNVCLLLVLHIEILVVELILPYTQ